MFQFDSRLYQTLCTHTLHKSSGTILLKLHGSSPAEVMEFCLYIYSSLTSCIVPGLNLYICDPHWSKVVCLYLATYVIIISQHTVHAISCLNKSLYLHTCRVSWESPYQLRGLCFPLRWCSPCPLQAEKQQTRWFVMANFKSYNYDEDNYW